MQTYLRTLVNLRTGEVRIHDGADWPSVEARVQAAIKDEAPRFRILALALAKYDYFGAPSNWTPSSWEPHEQVIKRWAASMLDRNHSDIPSVIAAYRKGDIPDAFGMM